MPGTSIHSPLPLLIAAVVAAGALVVLWRVPLPRLTKWLLAIATVLLVLAAGDPHAAMPTRGEVVVMVDLSPSTRSATYRNRASLDARLKQLLGTRKYRLTAFAEAEAPLPADATLPDLPATHTRFDPPSADAVVLFSDGRFDLPPSAPPTYAVIDPALIDPADAAIDDVRVDDGAATVTITGRGRDRVLSVTAAPPVAISPRDTTVHCIPLKEPPPIARAELSRGDIWPENDALAFAPPQPPQRQRWWIGQSPPDGWTPTSPDALTPENLLTPAVIAIGNIPADALPPAVQDRLQQYVRDLGGNLLILGGDRAFAAGGYSGSTIDALSPLSSDPPRPTTHWLLLSDASGSMAGGKWSAATAALAAAVRDLPPADLVSVGAFSADLRWWIDALPAADARKQPIPPANTSPGGPTNLFPVLQKLIDAATDDLPRELLILTDGETTLPSPDALSAGLKSRRIRLHVLAIGNGPALPTLNAIADATGGSYTAEQDAGRWLAVARRMLQASRTDLLRGPVTARFDGTLKLPSRSIDQANRAFIRPDASPLASDNLAARWQVGNGQVIAAAFAPNDAEREALAALIARPPRDPRFTMTWHAPGRRVIVDAAGAGRPLNGLALAIELRPLRGQATTLPLPQTAPGRYELPLPDSPYPRLAILRHAGVELDRQTLAGRYAREFAGIGVDEPNLRELARRTNGRVIHPADTGPILPLLWRTRALTPWLCSLAAVLIARALLHWKRV